MTLATAPPFSVKALAERWGVSRQHIYSLIRRGQLRAFPIGKRLVRIPADAVEGKTAPDFKPVLRKAPRPRPSLYDRLKREMLAPDDKSGFVYFIQCGRFIKIGYATCVPGRQRGLQVGNPVPLKVIGVFRAHFTTEGVLHRLLHKQRHRGEWFRLTPAIADLIKDLCEG